MMVSLLPLSSTDADRYNRFFAQGAAAHPDSLRIAPGDVFAAPFSTVESDEAVTFGAFAEDGALLGVGSLEREQGREKRRHIAWIVRMYVASGAAGKGVGRALLRTLIERGRAMPGVAKLNLTVAARNARAIALYESEGFRTFAEEEDAFRDPEPRGERSMSLVLRSE